MNSFTKPAKISLHSGFLLLILLFPFVLKAQTNVTYGIADVDPKPGVTGITYTSSNTNVAAIIGGKVHVVGVGTTIITGQKSGVSASQTVNVLPAPLTITANSLTGILPNIPTLTASYSGFVNGETEAVLTTKPALSTTATKTSVTGYYLISVSGAAAKNYTISYVPGTLTMVSTGYLSTPVTKTYGDADFYAFGKSTTGVNYTSSNTSIATISNSGLVHIIAAGSINIAVSGSQGSINKPLAINKATLTITADDAIKDINGSMPDLTASYNGLVNNDYSFPSPVTDLSITTNAMSSSPVGSYVITPSGSKCANYNLIFVKGNLKIIAISTPPKLKYNSVEAIENQPINAGIINNGGAVPTKTYLFGTTFGGYGEGYANGNTYTSKFNKPAGVVADALGNAYVADAGNHVIRKITPDNLVSTYAGNGSIGAVNGSAANTSFNTPTAITIDNAGNLYVADNGDNRIRKITSTGIVSTLAGSGLAGSTNGTGSAASFNNVRGLVADASGNIYVADAGNRLIRKITPAGQVTTIAGNGSNIITNGPVMSAGFLNPTGLVFDANQNLYVADAYQVRKITPAGMVTTFAGGDSPGTDDGTLTTATFDTLTNITLDKAGNFYVSSKSSIRKISVSGDVSTLTQSSPYLQYLGLFTNGNGDLWVVDSYFEQVQKLSLNGYSLNPILPYGLNFNTMTGAISGSSSEVFGTTKFIITGYNNIGYDTTSFTLSVKNYIPTSPTISSIKGSSNTGIYEPFVITSDKNGNIYYLNHTYSNNYSIQRIDASTKAISSIPIPPFTVFSFPAPYGLAVDSKGNMYYAYLNKISKVDAITHAVTVYAGNSNLNADDNVVATSSGLFSPAGIAFDNNDNLYICDRGNNKIRRVDAQTHIITTIAGTGFQQQFSDANGPAISTPINWPAKIVIDKKGDIYFSEDQIGLVKKVDLSTGMLSTVVGSYSYFSVFYYGDGGSAFQPCFKSVMGLAVDSVDNIYFSDIGSNVIRKVDKNTNIISTYCGEGIAGYSGDGGPSVSATLNQPYDISFDPAGNMYVADFGNNVIRKIGNNPIVQNKSLVANKALVVTDDKSDNLVIYPNPATTSANIKYNLPAQSQVIIGVYNKGGQLLNAVKTAVQTAGVHENAIETSGLKTGDYIIVVKGANYYKTGKLIVQ